MSAVRQRSLSMHPRDSVGHLRHVIATSIIAVLSLSPSICHVFADDSGEKQSRPNIVLIFADDKYWYRLPNGGIGRETGRNLAESLAL
jgi:hypothetical protein